MWDLNTVWAKHWAMFTVRHNHYFNLNQLMSGTVFIFKRVFAYFLLLSFAAYPDQNKHVWAVICNLVLKTKILLQFQKDEEKRRFYHSKRISYLWSFFPDTNKQFLSLYDWYGDIVCQLFNFAWLSHFLSLTQFSSDCWNKRNYC